MHLCKFSFELCFLIFVILLQEQCLNAENLVISYNKPQFFTNTWSVKLDMSGMESIAQLNEKADHIAQSSGAKNLGQVGELVGHYLFIHNGTLEVQFNSRKDIEWYYQQEILIRKKRVPVKTKAFEGFADPLYLKQWHLHNKKRSVDCNVTGVWKNNIAGKGVVVAVVDDGVQWQHPDLKDNYCPEGSFDLNSDDDDPTPVPDDKDENKHGTRCAGEIAAVPNNNVCGVGVAYKARFSGIRVLDGPMTDSIEATAFNKHSDINDIYSCSWGPEDDGKTVDGPRALAKAALKHGILAGRAGFGSVFVVASGNGGDVGDNCNYDGYASSIYTITIAAVDEYGNSPSYAEECTSMLACTVSSGSPGSKARKITTTDWTIGHNKDKCTSEHSGTSAATPLVAGMVALMLEARPCLTWRDVQHIFVMTATPIYEHMPAVVKNVYTTNAAGFIHSTHHGFGLLDSWKLVNAAKIWQSVPWLTSFKPTCHVRDNVIPNNGRSPLVLETIASEEDCDRHLLWTLEQVTFSVTLSHPSRGHLKFELVCPSGTKSIVPPRKKDTSADGLTNWKFATVRCWGEIPHGKYQLKIFDIKKKSLNGKVKSWQLTLYGSQMSSNDIIQRKSDIKNSLSGKFTSPLSNYSLSCPIGQPLFYDFTEELSEKTLKLVVLLSCFCALVGIYYTVEMAFCNAEDKIRDRTVEKDSLADTSSGNELCLYNAAAQSEVIASNEATNNDYVPTADVETSASKVKTTDLLVGVNSKKACGDLSLRSKLDT